MWSGIKNICFQIIKPIKEKYQAMVVCKYYNNSTDKEIREMVDYIKKRGRFDALNYSFTEKYKSIPCNINKDNQKGMFYVCYNGRRLYFPKSFRSAKRCVEYYRTILTEQDKESPHRYLSDIFNVDQGSIVVDAGAAEGNFSLDVIDKASKIILIECDAEWVEALNSTFEKEIREGKVEVLSKMLADYDDEKFVTIDKLYKQYGRIDFVKMDIEGGEERALRGGEEWLRESANIKLVVCAYHTPLANTIIEKYLEWGGCKVSHTKGYICPNPLFGFKPPYARKGLVQGCKLGGTNEEFKS